MSQEIKNIRLNFSCDADWEGMGTINGLKHCDQCQKKVYDFTDAKQNEFLKILAENNNKVCGRFSAEQMAPTLPVGPLWKKWASAAMVLLGINIFYQKADAQSLKPHAVKQSLPASKTEMVVGDIAPPYDSMPEFPGGMDKFNNFLLKNLHFEKGMKSGRVIISFMINKNGSLSGFKVERSVSLLNDNEAMRVLKLSPDWKPAMANGKAIKTQYMIPIKFEN